ncbi:MAG: AAA family ATPase, partial [Deltaproteobacteria bacterium]|nr:AAA family ATPase [Deltaproteobacteria bacterium]
MPNRSEIKEVIDSWSDWLKRCSQSRQQREITISVHAKKALALIGVRRSGKSYAATYVTEDHLENCFYLNFEDPFFIENNSVKIFDEFISVYTEYSQKPPKILIFDEVQNIMGWERLVRKIVDPQQYKLNIN